MLLYLPSGESPLAPPRRPFFAALLAAAFAAWLITPAARSSLLLPGAAAFFLPFAAAFVAGAFSGAARIVFPAFSSCPLELAWTLALACSALAPWLLPISLLLQRGNLAALPLALFIGVFAARRLRLCALALQEPSPAPPPSTLPYALAASIALQSALAFTLLGLLAPAAILIAAAAFCIASATPPLPSAQSSLRPLRGAVLHLLAASLLAWLIVVPRAVPHVDPSVFDLVDRDFGVRSSRQDLFSAAILLATPPGHAKLPAPLPASRARGRLRSIREPLAIPFSGVYWVLTPPRRLPPASALVLNESLLTYDFRAPDLTPLTVQAHQPLPFDLDPACCEELEVSVSNLDPRPTSIQILAFLATPDLLRTHRLSLGLRRLPAAPRAVLRFSIPPFSAQAGFDRILLEFELSGRRQHISPRLAIESFSFIPRTR